MSSNKVKYALGNRGLPIILAHECGCGSTRGCHSCDQLGCVLTDDGRTVVHFMNDVFLRGVVSFEVRDKSTA